MVELVLHPSGSILCDSLTVPLQQLSRASDVMMSVYVDNWRLYAACCLLQQSAGNARLAAAFLWGWVAEDKTVNTSRHKACTVKQSTPPNT